MQEEEYNEAEQSCFDIFVSTLVDGVMHDKDMELDEEDRAYIIDEVLNVLEDHLDEEGLDMLNAAFEKFENEYNIALKAEDIINSLDWHKNDNKDV